MNASQNLGSSFGVSQKLGSRFGVPTTHMIQVTYYQYRTQKLGSRFGVNNYINTYMPAISKVYYIPILDKSCNNQASLIQKFGSRFGVGKTANTDQFAVLSRLPWSDQC